METYNKGVLEGEQVVYYPADPSKVKVKEYENLSKMVLKTDLGNNILSQVVSNQKELI